MVLEFPPELPDLDLSEQLPELSELPDLDADLALESKPSLSANNDFDLDDLLSFNSDFNSEFEKEFGLEEKTFSEVADINDLLDQIQPDPSFADLDMASLESLDDLMPLDSEPFSQTAEFDFANLLDDFASAETMLDNSPASEAIDQVDSIDQLLNSMQQESAEDLSLPELDDSFSSPTPEASVIEADKLEDLSNPFSSSEILSETQLDGLSLGSEMSDLGLEDLVLESQELSEFDVPLSDLLSDTDSLVDGAIAETIETETIDQVVEFDPFDHSANLVESQVEDIGFESDMAELSELGLEDLAPEPLDLSEFDDPLTDLTGDMSSDSLSDMFSGDLVNDVIAESINVEADELNDLSEEFDPFAQSETLPEILGETSGESRFGSLSFEPEMASLSLEDDIQNPALDLAELSDFDSPELSGLNDLGDLGSELEDGAIAGIDHNTDQIEESDPFEQAVSLFEIQPEIEFESQSLEQTFEPASISGFTAILTSETIEEAQQSISTAVSDLPAIAEQTLPPELPSILVPEPSLTPEASAQNLVPEKFPALEEEEQIETFTQSFGDQDPVVSDFTQILTSAQVTRGMVEEEELVVPDLADSSDSNNNRFISNQSIPTSTPTPEPFQSQSTDSDNGSIASQDTEEGSNPLVKFGLPILLIGLLIGGIAMLTKQQGSNNSPQNPPAQTN